MRGVGTLYNILQKLDGWVEVQHSNMNKLLNIYTLYYTSLSDKFVSLYRKINQ